MPYRFIALLLLSGACGASSMAGGEPAPYAASVERFEPGEHAGFGQADMPDIVLGPPGDLERGGGSLDVVSLGVGGTIVLGFGELEIVDGPGPDLIVFENPFWPDGNPSAVFAELGEVAVSEDGERWHAFACDPSGSGDGRFPGCAGWTPTADFDPLALPLDPARSGGDAFDLAELGVTRAAFVRIVDLASGGDGNAAGFDLDAVGLVHAASAAP